VWKSRSGCLSQRSRRITRLIDELA
jgi:hypothetical protein